MSVLTSLDRYRRLPTEAGMRQAIAEAVEARHGRLFYVRDSRAAPETEDLPDLLIVTPISDGVLAAMIELKSYRRTVTDGQQAVASLTSAVTHFIGGIVRPIPREGELSYDDFLRILQQ